MKNSLVTWYNANGSETKQTELVLNSSKPIDIKTGDKIHCFVPKSLLKLHVNSTTGELEIKEPFESNYQITAYGHNGCSDMTFILNMYAQNSGLKAQQSENFTEFEIYVGSAPDTNNYRQFAIQNSKGQNVLPTFYSQTSDFDTYMVELKHHFETNGLVPCFCEIRGNFMKILVKRSGSWQYRNEKFEIGLGDQLELNTNTPTISAVLVNSEAIAASNRYRLSIIDDITEGNIFVFKGKQYIANINDTPTSILKALTGGADEFNSQNTSNIYTEVGNQIVKNTNNINFRLLYSGNSGGNDLYTIEGSNFVEGNILELLVDGISSKRYVVKANDTITEIRNFFYTSGYVYVSDSSSADVQYSQGQRTIPNSNMPGFKIELLESFPARTVENYEVTIGTSIESGNTFVLGSKSYVAKDDDTFEDVRANLGLESGEFYQVTQGTVFDCYAQKGFKYDDDNIADVKMVSGGLVRESDLIMAIIEVPEILNANNALIRFVIEPLPYVFGNPNKVYSNFFNVYTPENMPASNMEIAYRSKGKYMGIDYYDSLFYQKCRYPIVLSNASYESEEEITTDLNGRKDRKLTNIIKKYDLNSSPLIEHQADSLIVALSHKEVYLDGKKYIISGLNKTQISFQSKTFSVSGIAYPQYENINDNNDTDTLIDEYADYTRIRVNNTLDIMKISFMNNDFESTNDSDSEIVMKPFESFVSVKLAYQNLKLN